MSAPATAQPPHDGHGHDEDVEDDLFADEYDIDFDIDLDLDFDLRSPSTGGTPAEHADGGVSRLSRLIGQMLVWEHALSKLSKMREQGGVDGQEEEEKQSYLTKRLGALRERLREEKRKLASRLSRRGRVLKMQYDQKVFLIDKIGFFLGVLNSWMTVALLASNSGDKLLLWLSVWSALLIITRWIVYYLKGWQYFLLDLCYFINGMVLVYVYWRPNDPSLFMAIFSLTNGPVLWAIVLWRNSLIFHDLDKMTSLFIHAAPALMAYVIRWEMPHKFGMVVLCDPGGEEDGEDEAASEAVWNTRPDHAMCGPVTWKHTNLYPLVFYITWQLVYFAKTNFAALRFTSSTPVSEDENVMTSFKWLIHGNGCIARLLQRGPKKLQQLGFIAWQLVYTIVCSLPVYFMYTIQAVHQAILVLVFACSVWNGASFYMEIFSKRYAAEAQKKYEAAVDEARHMRLSEDGERGEDDGGAVEVTDD